MEFLLAPQTLAITATAAAGLGLTACCLLLFSLKRTTLIFAIAWAAVAFVAVGAVEVVALLGDSTTAWHTPLRFSTAVLTFCPLMSVLGARRPHDRFWQFIVLSLWGVLILPALEVGLLRPGRELEVHDLRGWFLWVLLGVQLVNYPPFLRFGWAWLAVSACQIILLSEYLPLVRTAAPDWLSIGSLLLAGATALAAAAMIATTKSSSRRQGLQRLWRDFRDLYGTLWAMRLAQRINGSASLCEWPIRVSLGGFYDASSGELLQKSPSEVSPAFEKNLQNLFRRFVDKDWIENFLSN